MILNHHLNESDIPHEAEFYSSDSDFEDTSSMAPPNDLINSN